MAVFAYKATDSSGAVRGSIAADTPRQARDQLRARGLRIEEIRSQATTARSWLGGRRGRYEAQLVPVVRELATLLSALADALRRDAITPRKKTPKLPLVPIDDPGVRRYYLRITRLCSRTVFANPSYPAWPKKRPS